MRKVRFKWEVFKINLVLCAHRWQLTLNHQRCDCDVWQSVSMAGLYVTFQRSTAWMPSTHRHRTRSNSNSHFLSLFFQFYRFFCALCLFCSPFVVIFLDIDVCVGKALRLVLQTLDIDIKQFVWNGKMTKWNRARILLEIYLSFVDMMPLLEFIHFFLYHVSFVSTASFDMRLFFLLSFVSAGWDFFLAVDFCFAL